MVRLLIPFLAGILFAIYSSIFIQIPWYPIAFAAILLIIVEYIPTVGQRFSKSIFFGVLLFSFLFVFGYMLSLSHNQSFDELHFMYHSEKNPVFVAKINEIPEEKENSFKTILEIMAVKSEGNLDKAKGKVLTYFEKDSSNPVPATGSIITFAVKPAPINKALNPGGFDYRRYMANHNVFHQVYLPSYSWSVLEKSNNFSIMRFAYSLRQNFISTLQKNGLKNQEFAVAAALLLGQDDMLDAETRSNYSGAGVVHILCVSGLHVGVIFLIINTLLKIFKRSQKQKYINTAIILISIWAYALLTGLAPSVLRAATMFTFITLGNLSNRYVHIINSLAASAFFLLILNPMLITNIGFQLSYLAVIGIVFLNPYILSIWNTKNRITDYIWGLVAVSVSAQIATSPLSILYFHQFPVYFIPANLIAVPLSGFIIYTGLLVLITSPISMLSNFFGLITSYMILALNYCVGFIENLPFSVQHIVFIGSLEFVLLYALIIILLLMVALKRKNLIFVALSIAIAISLSISINTINHLKQKKIIVYHANKNSILGFVKGNSQTLLALNATLKDKNIKKYTLQGAADKFGIKHTSEMERDSITNNRILRNNATGLYAFSRQMFFFEGKRIVFADSLRENNTPANPLKVDIVVLNKHSKFKIKKLVNFYHPEIIVIEPSVPNYWSNKWKEECDELKIPIHLIGSAGAYEINL